MPRGVSRYDEASLQGRLWSPQVLRPLLWLDASDVSTIAIATGVSEWRDKSGNGLHVSQATATNQPSLVANGINGIQAIDWGTASNSKSLNRSSLSSYSPVRYYGVADYDGANPPTGFRTIVSHNYTAAGDILQLQNASVEWWTPGINKTFLNGAETSSGTALSTIANPFVFGTDNSPSSSRTDVYVGNDRNQAGRAWMGKLGEILSFSAIPSSRERSLIEGYLAWKWGIFTSLRSTHPFYNRPPLIGD